MKLDGKTAIVTGSVGGSAVPSPSSSRPRAPASSSTTSTQGRPRRPSTSSRQAHGHVAVPG